MSQSQIPAALRYLKQAAANLSSARHALGTTDPAISASIDHLLRGVLAEIRRLEQLHPGQS